MYATEIINNSTSFLLLEAKGISICQLASIDMAEGKYGSTARYSKL